LSASISHYFLGNIEIERSIPIIIGFLIGAVMGKMVNKKVSSRILERVIATTLILAGVAVVFSAFVN
ncbi:MAG TPA: sulfite exporter TauE/SafE family protein, partial [Salinimicrobium sp.]|nr:sulfite exporter TauE/SafE family protein [Salinimicrobium sp.]